jgi:hypothetical protein
MANAIRPLGATPTTAPELGPGPILAGNLQNAATPTHPLVGPEPCNPALNQAAERVGRAIRVAVEKARELPARVVDARKRFTLIKGRTKEDASRAASEWKQTAQQKLHEGRSRAQRLAYEQPLYVIAGTVGITFVLGFVLRIWRSRNAHNR